MKWEWQQWMIVAELLTLRQIHKACWQTQTDVRFQELGDIIHIGWSNFAILTGDIRDETWTDLDITGQLGRGKR